MPRSASDLVNEERISSAKVVQPKIWVLAVVEKAICSLWLAAAALFNSTCTLDEG
jgi:hypothetical protein